MRKYYFYIFCFIFFRKAICFYSFWFLIRAPHRNWMEYFLRNVTHPPELTFITWGTKKIEGSFLFIDVTNNNNPFEKFRNDSLQFHGHSIPLQFHHVIYLITFYPILFVPVSITHTWSCRVRGCSSWIQYIYSKFSYKKIFMKMFIIK